jgi:hypothetical protein
MGLKTRDKYRSAILETVALQLGMNTSTAVSMAGMYSCKTRKTRFADKMLLLSHR